ncbi:Mismatch repair protein msh3 [Malassezia vespertilionis]|nr:Mismatch repair protein msh3 [Malassezia vespertilionis]WFD07976.1 Mismatch repair protein msh3 [Malassezia vespertilionis]
MDGTAREGAMPAPETRKKAKKTTAPRSRATSSAALSGAAAPSYTPLEQQILALKEAHPDVLLLVEVGYKMKMVGEDAHTASRILNIACFSERNLATAMIPVPRLAVHVKRLVAHGLKVGVCRQTETRALKAATEHANRPFARELTGLYTSSTWIDDIDAVQALEEVGAEQIVLAVAECAEVGIAALDVATGAITYDAFRDDAMRTELETRLAHLVPQELLLPTHLSEDTRRAVRAYTAVHPNVRIEHVADCDHISTRLGELYSGTALASVLAYAPATQAAFVYLVQYLGAFQLTSAFATCANYCAFTDRASMRLNGHTLANLELLRTREGKVQGTLFAHLDHCKTPMGKRRLRAWLRRPLLQANRIAERLDAVDCLRVRRAAVLHTIPSMLVRIPDLARGLSRIAYGLAAPTELATVLLSLHRITHTFPDVHSPLDAHTASPVVDRAIADLGAARECVARFLDRISIPDARNNDKVGMFPTASENVLACRDMLAEDEAQFVAHLEAARTTLHRPKLQYTSVSGVENLIEVRASDVPRTPADWVRISSTKLVVRFHTPAIVRLSKLREQHRELLAEGGKVMYADFLREVAQAYAAMHCVVEAVALLDALSSLAAVASLPGYVRPTVQDGAPHLALTQFRHPVSETRTAAYVPNDIALGGAAPHAVLLTGANMGGKSSTARAIALVVILAQMGSFVPCADAQLTPHDAIMTRMGAHDELVSGKSTFMVEAEETAHILKTATPKTMVLLDEFGRGTSTFDGTALAYAVLESFLAQQAPPRVLFITHYMALGALVDAYPKTLCAMHLAVKLEGPEHVVFLHKLVDGLAQGSLGMYVALLAGLPRELVACARQRAASMDRRRVAAYSALVHALVHTPLQAPPLLRAMTSLAACRGQCHDA